jgi:hypothetical protein
MKRIALAALALALGGFAFGQKYSTKTGKISFFSSAKMEDITAENNQVTAVLESSTGEMAVVVLIKSFEFEKALMQQHFNENYMHSDKFPKSTFSGKVTNLSSINFSKDGTYPATVSGKLTIHGVTKDVTEKGEIVVKGNSATLKSKFNVALADYDIKNDKLQNISNTIEVTVNTTLSK